MSELIEAITKTRKIAEEIAAGALEGAEGKSEAEIRNRILEGMKNRPEIYPTGWYDPPPGGVAVIFDINPYTQLQYGSLRNQKFWPRKDVIFSKKTVNFVYLSPVNKGTSMLGDMGFTMYSGEDAEIKEHINKCFELNLAIAQSAKIGMKFKDIASHALKILAEAGKRHKSISLISDPNNLKGINLGHTIPGSFEGNLILGNTFDEIKENIRTKRIFLDEKADFEIPKTCAFTLESRISDIEKDYLPYAYFHFIVTFDNGIKNILMTKYER